MIVKHVKHIVRLVRSILRERYKKQVRSTRWRAVERKFLAKKACAACGETKWLQVHHKKPYHLYPQLELEDRNLIVLCMGEHECHLRIGHGDNFRCWNPNVESDAAIVRVNPHLRSEYESKAKANRLS